MKQFYYKISKVLVVLVLSASYATAQSYPPQVNIAGSTAISANDSSFKAWATGAQITRGYQDIAAGGDLASVGSEANAIGAPGNVVSLGDAGVATLTFDKPITNGTGFDFAVFENGFLLSGSQTMAFLELAFVEVSSNGTDYFRFPSVNEYPEDYIANYTGSGGSGFATMDATYLHNVAGKYIGGYGTPFDLDDLADDPKLDKTNIKYVRIIDVVGDNGAHATYDSQGNKMIDPYPTPYASSGFDLNAVGVIHEGNLNVEDATAVELKVYPTQLIDWLNITAHNFNYQLYNSLGQVVQLGTQISNGINVALLKPGVYYLNLSLENGQSKSFKIIKK